MEFFTWTLLGTYAGCLAATLLLTQLLKPLWPQTWPTQLLSYIIALLTLVLADLFTGTLATNIPLIIFNGAIVALAANGGFNNIKEAFGKKSAGAKK